MRGKKIVVLGLSVTSSWGNGHATTFRGLLRELALRGHEVTFLERDVPWYAENRDFPRSPDYEIRLYRSLPDLGATFEKLVRTADAVMVGSHVPEGVQVGDWVHRKAGGVTAFYDIDTPVTLSKLARGQAEYLAARQIPEYGVYLSFTGGPTLKLLEKRYGARKARPLYCSVDPALYYPEARKKSWDLGYLGTYSPDRQPALNALLIEAARRFAKGRFVVAGPQYPGSIQWPANVRRLNHLPPSKHRAFYNRQRFTLNVTRADMIRAGWSPSVRLFEAAACATPIISDSWPGLEHFFEPGEEILVAKNARETLEILAGLSEQERERMGRVARARVLAAHTARHRARELEEALFGARKSNATPRLRTATLSRS